MKSQRLQLCISGAALFKLNIEIKGTFLDHEVRAFESQRVTVGIITDDEMARNAQPKSKGFKNFPTGKALKIKSKSKKLTMKSLVKMLDKKYGFISNAAINEKNADLILVMNELKRIFDGKVNPRRIENGAIALVRNQIMRKDFGNNKQSTVNQKGFDQPLVRTGAMFKSIKARYTA